MRLDKTYLREEEQKKLVVGFYFGLGKWGEAKLKIKPVSMYNYPFTAVLLSVKVSALFGASMLCAANVNSLHAADCLVRVPLLRYDDLLIVWGRSATWETCILLQGESNQYSGDVPSDSAAPGSLTADLSAFLN